MPKSRARKRSRCGASASRSCGLGFRVERRGVGARGAEPPGERGVGSLQECDEVPVDPDEACPAVEILEREAVGELSGAQVGGKDAAGAQRSRCASLSFTSFHCLRVRQRVLLVGDHRPRLGELGVEGGEPSWPAGTSSSA